MSVSLVIVSHSEKLAAGVAELAGQMAGEKVAIGVAGGAADGSLGTSVDKILDALRRVSGPDGTLLLLDLGSAVMAAEMAVETFALEEPHPVEISSAPLVEGAVLAAVEASIGSALREVAEAAAAATELPKVQKQQ